ncbi:hypothetical protein BLOT_004026 [Blomia tropicalis]|nr:hypothetical protein BLOT_004026 [Blomia tropicalis]
MIHNTMEFASIALLVFSTVCMFQSGATTNAMGIDIETSAAHHFLPAEPLVANSTLNCYQCNSFIHAGCESNKTLKSQYLMPCPELAGQRAVGCWALHQEVDYDQSQELVRHDRVVRQCAYKHQESHCIFRTGYGAAVTHCYCNNTACNPANMVTSNPIFTLLSTLAVVVFLKLAILS